MSTKNLDVLSLTFPRYIPLNKQRSDLFLLSPWMSFVCLFFLIWAERSLKSIPDERERKREEAGGSGREREGGREGKGGLERGNDDFAESKKLDNMKKHYGVPFCKENIFLISIYIADMAI